MNWDTVRYIFQIPIKWYRTIEDKIFKAYGSDFIVVRDTGDTGGMHIDVDEDVFASMVSRIAGGGIKTVDYIPSTPDGNIPLSAIRTINGEGPDISGELSLDLSGIVHTVDWVSPDEDGNISLSAVRTINGVPPDEYGDISIALSGTVTSVNGIEPDLQGNVELTDVVYSVNGRTPDEYGNVYLNLSSVVKTVDHIQPDEHGNIPLNAIQSINGKQVSYQTGYNLTGVVMTINGAPPDISGNFELSDAINYVKTVNNEEPDLAGNVDVGTVKSVNNIQPDANGNVELEISGDYVTHNELDEILEDYSTTEEITQQLESYATTDTVNEAIDTVNEAIEDLAIEITDELIDYVQYSDLSAYVKSVDGKYPDENGDVDFNLSGDCWVMTDAAGHLTTTNIKPLSASANKTGYVYLNNGVQQFKDEAYVDVSSDQSNIGGNKIWTGQHNWSADSGRTGTSIDGYQLIINGATPYINLGIPGTAIADAFITLAGTSHELVVMSPLGVQLRAPANKAILEKQPTDTATSSLAIATCGYVQTQALTLSSDQIITGQKTFKKELRVGFDGLRDVNSRIREIQGLRFRDSNSAVVGQLECELGATGNNILRNYVYKNSESCGTTYWIDNNSDRWTQTYTGQHTFGTAGDNRMLFLLKDNCSMMFYPKVGTQHGGYIDFRYGGADAYTSRIVDDESNLTLYAKAKNVLLRTDQANQAKLSQAPTIPATDQTSLAIATCGYVNRAVAAAAPDTSKFVTINTTQTVTGQKTFTATNTYTNNLNVTGSVAATGTVTTGSESTGTSRLEYGRLYLQRDTPALYLQNGNYTGLLYMAGTEMRVQNTTGSIQLNGINVYRETTPPDTDATDAKNIPTLGWCNSKFGKVKTVNGVPPDSSGNVIITTGGVQTVDHISPDDQGNVQINAIRTINGHNADINGDFSGVVTSVNNIVPTDGNVQLTGYVETINGTAPDQLGNIDNVAMEVDGHQADTNGVVSFGLANGKWVKTDGDGHLTTTDETPIAIDTQQYQPKTVTKRVVTHVVWNGTTLVYSSENWQFVNGVLVNVTVNDDTLIDTPVAYSATFED